MSDSSIEYTPLFRWKRWIPITGLLLVLILVYAWDQQLKKTPLQGLVVEQADWTIGADNVPVAWQALYDTHVWETLRAESDPLREPIVDLRKRLGVRLSPQRWKTWLGTSATLSGVGEEWLLVTCPGVLIRLLDMANGSSQHYGPYHYRWHEGFICISRSESVVKQIGSESITFESVAKVGDSRSMHILTQALSCTVRVDGELSITGEMPLHAQPASIQWDSVEPFASVFVLKDFVPEWTTSNENHKFQGNLEVKAVDPTEDPLPTKE